MTPVVLERPGARLRLLVFPHAGGSGNAYIPLAQRMPSDCEPCLFDLPGRGVRGAERPAATFRAALADLAPRVTAAVDRPSVLLGHSFGAMLVHSLVAVLPDAQRRLVRAVVVSGSISPADQARKAGHPARPFELPSRSRERLLTELRQRGGSPAELFAEPDILDMAIAMLGQDLHLADTYVAPGTVDLDADYHVWYGRDDPHVTPAEAARWAESVTRPPVVRDFRGGHFYLQQEAEPLAALRRLVVSV